ncbi:MAG: hypothetical protein E7335_09250 [Clostridiales bacterium]|nr:hypothetical protein [Clostridiales bacterium]
MSRTKFIACILLITLFLPSLAYAVQSDNLIDEERIQTNSANYVTETVRRGTYERVYSSGAKEYYPYKYKLSFDIPGAKFGEYKVVRGDKVKAGDVLATFTLETDEIAMTSKRLSLSRMQESFEAEKLARENELFAMREQLSCVSDRFDREILQLRIERKELELERYIYDQNYQIESLAAEIAEIEAHQQNTQLVSPVDAVISKINYKRTADPVSPGEILIEMYSTDGMLMIIENPSSHFRYGMDVQIEIGSSKERSFVTGRVVAADTLVPEGERTGYAYIKLDPYDEETVRFTNPIAKASTYYLENVLLLSHKALVLDGGKYYVHKLVDGMVQKRFVQYIINNGTDAWMLEGVSEGETLIID